MVERRLFEDLPNIGPIYKYIFSNKKGVVVEAIDYGCAITNFWVPDKNHIPRDVVLGYDNGESYRDQDEYMGAIIGRYANRISGAAFSLSGRVYELYKNDGPNHLHGGKGGFDKKLWHSRIEGEAVLFQYHSKDGEEGYPGNMDVTVKYALDEDNCFTMAYYAVSDQPTPCNLTNHTYFNLGGHGAGYIGDHLIAINSDFYTPADDHMIPLGVIDPVDNTPMDLRKPLLMGLHGEGYDNNFVLNKDETAPAAVARCGDTGIEMEVYTTLPCLQFYTGNFLKGRFPGKEGAVYGKGQGFCLETQQYPDSMNNGFPKAFLDPSAAYAHTTSYRIQCHG